MPIPFTADYRWQTGKPSVHFATVVREHQDLCDIARVLNNLRIQAVNENEPPSIEKCGTTWDD